MILQVVMKKEADAPKIKKFIDFETSWEYKNLSNFELQPKKTKPQKP